MKKKWRLILLTLLVSCSSKKHSEIIGDWEVIRFEHKINGKILPENESLCHYSFTDDSLTILCLGYRNIIDTLCYSYQVKGDSIFIKTSDSKIETGMWKFSIQHDSLILEEEFRSKDWNQSYKYILGRISRDSLGVFNHHDGIIGDWKYAQSYLIHKDSAHNTSKSHFWFTKDLMIGKDFIFELNYPCFYKSRSPILIQDDSITIFKNGVPFKKSYSLIGDTLRLISRSTIKKDTILIEDYYKDYFDNGTVDFLLKNKVDPNCFEGRWKSYDSEEYVQELKKKYPEIQILDFNFPTYENWSYYDNLSYDIYFIEDTINISISDAIVKFKIIDYSLYKSGHCSGYVLVAPIYNDMEIESWLLYEEP